MNHHWLTRRLRSWGDHPALIWRDERWSFTQLCEGCDAWLGELARQGVKPGDTLAICGDYSPNLCALLLAALLNRNIIVPLSSATAPRWNRLMELAEIRFAVRFDRDDSWHITGFDRAVSHPLLRQIEEREASGLVLFSSGSTGESKASVLDFDRLLAKFETPAAGLSYAHLSAARPYRRHQHAVARALSRRDHRHHARAQSGRRLRRDRGASDRAAADDADVSADAADRRRRPPS